MAFPEHEAQQAVGGEPIAEAAARLAAEAGLELVHSDEGLALEGDGMRLVVDFTHLVPRLKPARLRSELLVRAAWGKAGMRPCGEGERPRAVDATAGLGEDALLLAASGFMVDLYERDPVIAALLADGVRRAVTVPALAEAVGRMRVHAADSMVALPDLPFTPDVVYLDPMFPARRKSAAVKKKFQLLHHLERPCPDEHELFDAACAAHPRRVVIKRPAKGAVLAGAKPSYALAGKAVRYDVLVFPR